jgi:hypothetical protein
MYNQENATETLRQLTMSNNPVGTLTMFLGAYHIAFSSKEYNVSFKFKARAKNSVNYCKITLTAMDDYTMELGRIRDKQGVPTYKKVEEIDGLYWEDLKGAFERHTGLYLSL